MSGRQVGKKVSPNRDYDISFVKLLKQNTKRGSNASFYKEKYALPNAHLELTQSEAEDEFTQIDKYGDLIGDEKEMKTVKKKTRNLTIENKGHHSQRSEPQFHYNFATSI